MNAFPWFRGGLGLCNVCDSFVQLSCRARGLVLTGVSIASWLGWRGMLLVAG